MNNLNIDIDIDKIEIRSIYGWREVVYTAFFNIIYENTKVKWTFDFTRDPISWIAYIKEILNIEEQKTEDTLFLDKDQIIDILYEKLNA